MAKAPQQHQQTVRLLNSRENKQVTIQTDPQQGLERFVYWHEIEKAFLPVKLALFVGAGLEFQRNSDGHTLMPLQIKAQYPEVILVQPVDDDSRQMARDIRNYRDENLALHSKSHAMLENVLLTVKAGIQALFALPDHSIPRMFIVVPEPTAKYNPSNMMYRSYRLFFLCECGNSLAAAASTADGGISRTMHFAHHGGYEIRKPQAFIQKYGKHMMKVLDIIQSLATIASTIPSIFNASRLPSDIQKALKATDDNCLPRIKEIADHLENVLKSTDDTIDSNHCQVLDGPDLRAVESYLVRKDESRALGNLHRILTPDYKIKWVCDQHVQENARITSLGVLRHAIQTYGGTIDEKRGLVTVRLTSSNAENFFKIIEEDSLIQELDITLDFRPKTGEIRTLRQHMKSSQVSSLSINIDVPDGDHILLGVVRKVSGAAQLLKLLELKKVGKPGPFRNLSIKGISNILEEYEYNECLAHSLTLDQVSFQWEHEKSRKRLLDILGKAPDLSTLRLCSRTLMEGHDMASKLAEKSHRLRTIEISTQNGERLEFSLNAGLITTIAATVHASALSIMVDWGKRIERLAVMAGEGQWTWTELQPIISNSQCLARLDLHCPVNKFCYVFQQIKATVGPDSSLQTLSLRYGETELLTRDLSDPTRTTTIKMKPEEEQKLGFWTAFSLFGLFPAYDASPFQVTDEQFRTLQDHFTRSSEPMRLRELNFDVSKLTSYGHQSLNAFLQQYRDVNVRLSGTWTRDCHVYITQASLGRRLTGFDMVVNLAGLNPLENGASALFEILNLIHKSVSIPNARLRFHTDKGNIITIPDVHSPRAGSFNINRDDEPFDFALTRYFGHLPTNLLCNNGFSDSDAEVLQKSILDNPRRLQYLSLSIHDLSPQSLHDLESSISRLPRAELKINWSGREVLDRTTLQARLQFLSKVANRTCELNLEDISNLGDIVGGDAPPSWPVLRSVSLRNIQTTEWFATWMQWMVSSQRLQSLCFVGLGHVEHKQWRQILKDMRFSTLESVRIESSRLPRIM
ncbi:hypothetical protein BGZ96_000874 [Linnemannia gamsii]|uniref:RNI-like protein n=1 Tax=Linnemannia gamsii TaxID=64522 RepID=A0ABQ7KAY4_9FUNG|nr:hypothetical protein BGZ96_000874 [Linnemannia gamsii]